MNKGQIYIVPRPNSIKTQNFEIEVRKTIRRNWTDKQTMQAIAISVDSHAALIIVSELLSVITAYAKGPRRNRLGRSEIKIKDIPRLVFHNLIFGLKIENRMCGQI